MKIPSHFDGKSLTETEDLALGRSKELYDLIKLYVKYLGKSRLLISEFDERQSFYLATKLVKLDTDLFVSLIGGFNLDKIIKTVVRRVFITWYEVC